MKTSNVLMTGSGASGAPFFAFSRATHCCGLSLGVQATSADAISRKAPARNGTAMRLFISIAPAARLRRRLGRRLRILRLRRRLHGGLLLVIKVAVGLHDALEQQRTSGCGLL